MQFNHDIGKNKTCYSAALIKTNNQNMFKVCVFAYDETLAYKLFISNNGRDFFFRYPKDNSLNIPLSMNRIEPMIIQFMNHINEFVQNGNNLDGRYWKPIFSVLPTSDDPIFIKEYFLSDED